jgi:AraC-like DNA-binding protein
MLARKESITSIAEQLGYSSLASFSFAFRRSAGVSPRQFRARVFRSNSAIRQ